MKTRYKSTQHRSTARAPLQHRGKESPAVHAPTAEASADQSPQKEREGREPNKKRFFPSRAEPPLESFQSKQPRSSSRKPLYCRHCCVCCFLLTLCSLIFSISRGASLMVRLLLLLRQRGVFLGRRYLLSLFFRCFLQKKKARRHCQRGPEYIRYPPFLDLRPLPPPAFFFPAALSAGALVSRHTALPTSPLTWC